MPRTYAATYRSLCSPSTHPATLAWVNANMSTDFASVLLVTEHDDGSATVTATGWTVNARSGNASHPLTGHGTYHLRRWVRGEYGTAMGSVQASHKVHLEDAAALAADWSAIAASAPFVHTMLCVNPNA